MESITLGNIIASAALLATFIGLAFTALQIRKNTSIQRAMFFTQLYEPFFLYEEMQYVFMLIENGEDIFRPGFGTSDIKEKQRRQRAIERLFAHLEIICSLHRRGMLSQADMGDFDYNIQRLFNHPGFEAYEQFLDNWRRSKGLARGPYSNLFTYTNANRSRLTLSVDTDN